jgi:hypothetical protein
VLLLGLASWWARSTLAVPGEAAPDAPSSFQKGTAPVSDSHLPADDSSFRDNPYPRLARLISSVLCATVGLGCPAAQVRRPKIAECPPEARRAMFQQLRLKEKSSIYIVLDIHQPGDNRLEGVYRTGPIISRVMTFPEDPPGLPEGTLLYGQLWTGSEVKDDTGSEAVVGRYDRALLPDGREYPVCLSIGDESGGLAPLRDARPDGTVGMTRMVYVTPLSYFP